ncbi:MAG: DISARM system phospholipase D-like protein DrmC [Polyangiaceae bacterium]|nr:DISARM system phospholipase D-like protein DrmC [Polyangiaceae bacterium]
MDALLEAIVTLASDLPRDTVEALAAAVVGTADPKQAGRLAGMVVTAPAAQDRVRTMLERWPDGVSGASVALALRSASRMDNHHRTRQHIELVWTGPVPAGTSFRRSDQVLLEMVREAKRRITIVSFATYRVPVVHTALLAAAKREVEVVFIVESARESEGRVNIDPLHAIGSELAELARVYVWPREKRPTDENGNFGLLHAKCAIADGKRLLVSSANFTAAALAKNMELGVLIEGGEVPGVVEGHWEGLLTARYLARI